MFCNSFLLFNNIFYFSFLFFQGELHIYFPHKDNKDVTEITQAGLQFISVNDRPIKSKEIDKVCIIEQCKYIF